MSKDIPDINPIKPHKIEDIFKCINFCIKKDIMVNKKQSLLIIYISDYQLDEIKKYYFKYDKSRYLLLLIWDKEIIKKK